MPNPKFENLNTRRTDKCREKADRLARLMSAELGMPITRPTAIAAALDEALERHKGKKGTKQ